MAKRQKEWARKQRNQLHFLLGNKCCDCGTSENLQLDCDTPQGDEHHRKMAWDCRMRFYWKQFWVGNLKLRCLTHNARKGSVEDREYWRAWRAEQEAQKQQQVEQEQYMQQQLSMSMEVA